MSLKKGHPAEQKQKDLTAAMGMAMLIVAMAIFPIPEVELDRLYRRLMILAVLFAVFAVIAGVVAIMIDGLYFFIPYLFLFTISFYSLRLRSRVAKLKSQIKEAEQIVPEG